MSSMTQNHAAMKRCSRTYTIVSTVYVTACGFYILAGAYLSLIMEGSLYHLINGPLFKGAVLAAGFLGTYKKSNLFAGLAPIIMFFNTVLFRNVDNYFDAFWGTVLPMKIDILYLFMTIALAVLTIIANAKYRYLEQQEGFPQFSEVFEQQKTGKPQYGETYIERIEKLRASSRGDMDGIPDDTPLMDESRPSIGQMDEI
ncbi:MAG: hypothetical protein Q4A05_07040 [Ruminococcus sp.]|nr:hypothetical protein [Ruminococcus sp.]